MKVPTTDLGLVDALAEFDVWITPSLGEIRDTERFQQELDKVTRIVDTMMNATRQFSDVDDCSPIAIADSFASMVETMPADESLSLLVSLASVLFLVTGRSDNNVKCQLPLHLRDTGEWKAFPYVTRGKVSEREIPRELKAGKFMKAIVSLQRFPDLQRRLLREFCQFILSDERYVSQLWSIGRSYAMLKEFGKEKDLLTPLVVFQVRGSVSASGGHGPEELLRDRLAEWGLRSAVDFNTCDVVVPDVTNGPRRLKTRAYDFVLPYETPGWQPRLFIQCQFYAGDSGSVSHKNVDQTSTSRDLVAKFVPSPKFVEYVDGAGYFSSLNGDLRNLLSMPTTASFFQIRTAPVRLRRELQAVGFLTPLEVEHAILRTDGRLSTVQQLLSDEGYAAEETERCVRDAAARNLVEQDGEQLRVTHQRRPVARRYLLLDAVAIFGALPNPQQKLTGSIVIPGYGPFHAMKMDEVVAQVVGLAPAIRTDWSDPEVVLRDIRWLCDEGLAMSC